MRHGDQDGTNDTRAVTLVTFCFLPVCLQLLRGETRWWDRVRVCSPGELMGFLQIDGTEKRCFVRYTAGLNNSGNGEPERSMSELENNQ